ncbi:non-ribosomal peptide synthase/polyketide synthase [Longimicrobium sp.]|uniref:non-ribosomal peptide synthase/polyketide synthase n=1 Tax=Longimicrobium sp. TaxID=2029185 RepID=UPI003B3B4D9A
MNPTLSATERERLLKLARAASLERSTPKRSPIVPVERGGPLPLSFAQQRLWFIDRLEPGSAVYNMPIPWRLAGALDVAALERSVGEIVRRHEVLRTVFAEVDGSPVQVIAPFSGFALPVEDLSGLGEADREAAVRRRVEEEASRAFDLAAGPLFRAALLRLGAEDHVLLLSMHHIVGDEWSTGVLFRELSALYAAYREGRESPLPELPVQYADFAVWQREQLSGEALDKQLAYWRERLAGAPELLELPTDRPRPAVQTFRGSTVAVEFSLEIQERLQALGRSEGATLYMVLLAAFQVLLSKYSGSDDIVVGSPIAGRTRAEAEELIGFFVNTLVLRTDLSGDPSFRETLRRVRETTLGAYAHQELPFETLVAELRPERSLSHSPLFQVVFLVQDAEGGEATLPGLSVGGVDMELASAKFDLSLGLGPTPQGLRGALGYVTDLFERDTIERMLGHLERVLEQVAADADVRLSQLELVGETERARVLEEWNQTEAAYPADRCIHELFEAQAARTPDAAAVEFDGKTFSYRALNERANRLAHHLAGLGVGPEVRVGICLERGPEMVVSALAVLKAGGGYVPLDPAYPAERLAFMLADAAVPVLVTQESLRAALPAGDGVALVSVDGDGARIAAESAENPARRVSPDQLAYVIYTSGSTGRPKGVMVPHRGVPNLAYAQARRFGIDGSSRVLQFASFSFDAAVAELFDTLLAGATLVMAPRDALLPGAGLLETLRRGRVTVATLPPSVLAVLSPEDLPELRTVVSAGEAVDAATVQRWSAGRTFVNAYGPTETTVCATSASCEADGRGPTIGRPLENVRVYVLDAAGRPAPVGIPGELYVGGVGVARGYLGRPGLTAERFVPDPFGGETGARLYRTGDRVRWSARGELEFLGRVDEQVKVRGFRIEPGEIEAVLSAHAEVREARVIVWADASGEPRLVAYVAGGVEAEELRAHVRRSLPEYMVPSAFVVLEALPLTPNGKLDRKALPAPEYAADADRYVAPRTPTEEVLAGLWAEMLRLERVGAEASFFDLGGHSLLATRVAARVREVFGVDLPIRAVFERSVLSALAAEIDRLRGTGAAAGADAIAPAAREGDLPMTFAQERLWFVDALDPGSPAYAIPFSYRLTGALDEDALRRALAELVRRHEPLRTTLPAVDGVPVQRIAPPPAEVDLPVADLRHLPDDARPAEAARRMAAAAGHRFDLARGPLFRAELVRVGDAEHLLLLNMHHAVGDGWSVGVLLEELSALYGAFARGEASPLPQPALQYADFAMWQRARLSGTALEGQVEFWRRTLDGAPALLELPTDRPRPPVESHRGAVEQLAVPAELAKGIHALARREGATLFMVLLAALDVVLGRLAGQEDVVVGTPIAGRTRAETDRMVGLFLNSLALRTDLSGDPSFRELLARVRETTLAAYAHQDLPFERVLEEVRPERSMAHAPVFQVMLNLLNFEVAALQAGGLEVTELGGGGELTSKFDLTLYVAERDGGIDIQLAYAADLFDAPRMREMLAQLQGVLRQAAEAPETRIGALALATDAARAVLPDPAAPLDDTWRGAVHEVFAARAMATPDALAVEDPRERWTYAELHAATDAIARRLVAHGVGAGDVVAITGHRGAALVRALLGTMKSGAAFLVLDPSYPAARLAEYVRIARPAAHLHLSAAGGLPREAMDGLAESIRTTVVIHPRSEESAEALEDSGDPLGVTVGPDTLAYLSFTSGTTGVPKAVMGRHSALTHFTPWLASEFELSAADRFSLLSGLAHDPLHRDVFTPLQLGAAVVAPLPDETGTPGYLARWMREAGITVAHLTPAMGQVLADAAEGERIDSLRRAFFVGDVLRRGDVQRLAALAPNLRVINYYGSTETQRAVSYHVVDPDAEQKEIIPLGRGIPGVQLLVCNAAGALAGIGEVGEIWMRSPHLAAGYLNDPALAAERFLVNPWTGQARDRLYRTGDLGRYRPDGEVEPMGRADQQVQVRGFRVELGEVESALASHPAIKEAAVLAREMEGGDRRLVAYWVPVEGSAVPDAAALRAHLKGLLPEYMVPSAYVRLDRLPLTQNGKLDRRALPEPEISADAARRTAPRTQTEEILAGIWAEVLRTEAVGVDDDFFALGGHSLLATRLLARVQNALAVVLPLRALFEGPTVAELAARVDALRRGGARVLAPIVRVDRHRPLPLSFAQERLWFLDRLEGGSAAYNIPAAMRLSGALDVGALERSLGEIVRRHESLRTVFRELDEGTVQVIAPFAGFALPVDDLSGLGEADRETEARRRAREDAARPFNLTVGPLFRAALLRLADEEHVLLLCIHHIVSDGWSSGVLLRELSALYAAYREGGESPLPELPVQYADFAAWQREQLRGETLDRQIGYWKARLAGAPALLELPTDRPRPPVQSNRGARETFELPRALLDRLQALGRGEGATLYMVMLAAFQLLLSRYSGSDDVVVGSPIAGRTRREVEDLIGFFANTLVLRTDLSADPTFRELLARVREGTLGAYEHQEVPFERLVAELQPQRSLSHAPLVQVMFVLQNADRSGVGLEGLRMEGVAAESETTRFDMALTAVPHDGGVSGVVEYSTDLFDRATVRRMLGHLERVLEQAAARPEARLSELDLLSADERGLVVEEWNRTGAGVPADRCIHQLFEAQAARTPEAVAVVFEDASLTYAQLNARANQLAHHLRGRGVGPEVRVGVLMERSLEMMVSLLAILKAGGGYVPLDPGLPAERLAYMLEDSGVAVLLTQERLRGILPASEVPVLDVDGAWDSVAGESAENLAPAVTPSNVAYVIYTSGSTGRPKGVMNQHRGVVNRLVWMQAHFGIGPDDVVLQKTPSSFDVSVWEFFWPLQQGARLVMARPDGHRDPAYLRDVIEREGVTTLHFVPSMLQPFVEAVEAGRCGSLRHVVCSGEALPPALVRRFYDRFAGPVVLTNLYGPTEAAVDVSWWTCPRDEAADVVPIGRPVWNTQLYVLDAALKPVPVGVPGELYIGGVQVARGYQGRAGLTAERFIPDPFSTEPGARLYRTGDRARWRADGAIEYLGRLDFQVKVRGFRIELGEIETVLLGHPGVRDGVVLAREDVSGDPRLVAYLVPDRTHAAGVLELQRLEREAAEAGPRAFELPNGMGIAHLNAAETRFLYREIFEERSYLRHGVALGDGACVFDVGANIGLFTLFAGTLRPDVTVYAFEPIPPVFQALETNARIHGVDARLFNCGVGSTAGTETFTYYPHASVLSGRQVDADEARSVVRSYVLNEQDPGAGDAAGMDGAMLEEMLEARLDTEQVTAEIRTLSQVIREQGVQRIDLLKVDVEGGEYDVLAGIEAEHWDRISQVVAEAHDQDLERVTELLARHGFAVAVEQEHDLKGTGLHAVYAVRPGAAAVEPAVEAAPARRWSTPSAFTRDLRELGRERLPEHMVPSAFVFLDALPLTPNGKVDRKALPAPELASARDRYVAPRTPVEEVLAGIWAEVLRLERVGANDNFFDLGGHSLLATRVVSQVRELFGVELPLRVLFEAPTVAKLAGRVEEMRRAGAPALPAVVPVERTGALPLSFAQERLWFIDQLEPGSATYNIPAALRLAGALDQRALERALGEIVRRHEALRTVFAQAGGSPVQVIVPFGGFALPVEDLSGLDEADREAAVSRRAGEEAGRGFDLAAGPLFRAALLRLGDEDHVLLLSMHHIVSDGWSMGVLFRELSALYAAYREGRESPLPELAVQYADYAVWQRAQLEGEVLDRQLAYWKQRLSGAPGLLELPTDHARPAVQSFRGAVERIELSGALLERLQALGRNEGATLYMVVLGAFQLLLSRYSGSEDVVVGSPIAGRTRREVENLIGFFVNTLVLRTDLSGNPSFRETLRRVRAATLGAYEHQEVPFERLVAELQPERSLSHSPLFQVSFTLQDVEEPGSGLAELSTEGVATPDFAQAKFDLSLTFIATRQGLRGGLNYSTDLFEPGTIARMLGHLERVLEQVAADVDVRLSHLDLLGAAEREQVLGTWNQTERGYSDPPAHVLFAHWARRAPQATALLAGIEAVTYGELDRRASILARHLRDLGVGSETPVGLCMERTPELLVGVLGIWKAGGAYVPLDPGYPAERLGWMISDAALPVVVVAESTAGVLPEHGATLVRVDQLPDAADAAPELPASHASLAYVIYTSGSTGRPKGVQVQHGSLSNLLAATREAFGVVADDVMPALASYAFDIWLFEALLPLTSGAAVRLVERERVMDVPALAEEIADATLVHAVPALMRQIVESERETPRLGRLRRAFVGGDQVAADLLAEMRETLSEAESHVLYGPTEGTILASTHPVPADGMVDGHPIGRPLGNVRLYVCDAIGNAQPAGVPGELLIGGAGVARGYLGRPELTAERFVPDAFGAEPGARLYRTGDRARWRADGTLEFLGRVDAQVKIRGFRIEPGEIEALLRGHESVTDCVVVAREDVPGDRRLVAYVVGDVEAEELREHLRGSLPEYMVPAAFVALEALPLTPNGKLDRKALPAPEYAADADRYVAPRTPAEEQIAGIWAEVLKVDRVGVHDNFFTLGGHSLLAVALVERMRRRGVRADVRALFTTPTVAELAAAVEGPGSEVQVPPNRISAGAVAITPQMLPLVELTQAEIDGIVAGVPGGAENVQDIYPLAPLQEGILFHHLLNPENDPYLLPQPFSFESRKQRDAYLAALQAVIARHDILRTSVVWDGLAEAVQVVWRHAPLSIEEVEVDAAASDAAWHLYERVDPLNQRVDLSRAPMLRAYVGREAVAGRWGLLLLLHHMVSDHTTADVLREEMEAHLEGRAAQLPAPLPFRNYVAQARLGVSRAEHETFFRELLGDVDEPTAPFGLREVRGDGLGLEPGMLRVEEGLGVRLRERARTLGVSVAAVCHVAWAQVLARVSGRSDVVFGTVLFGRMQGAEGADRVLGPFINTLPVRIRVADEGAAASVRQAQALLASLVRHEHASLALAQQMSGVPAPEPLFSSLFNYRHVGGGGGRSGARGPSQALQVMERSNYPLNLAVNDWGDEFSLSVQVEAEVGAERVCALMHTALAGLIEALENAPERTLETIEVLPQTERALVLEAWNRTDAEVPADLCIHQLFEAQVERTPDAVAVSFEEDRLTYAELNARANRLAHHLRSLGVGPDARVGVCVERGPEMVAALLAILKAGGAYVPLDPAYPADRLRYMLEDSAPAALITQSSLAGTFAGLDVPVVDLDARAWTEGPDTNPVRAGLTPGHLAYVIYTSGSTGRPKGVMVAHRSLVNHTAWQATAFGIGAGDTVLQRTSISFDASVWELWTPLSTGARMLLLSSDAAKDPEAMGRAVAEGGVTIAQFVPTLLQAVLGALPEGGSLPCRILFCGGEALSAALVEEARAAGVGEVVNLYGPTEATIDSTSHVCAVDGRAPAIGRPIANARIYVLDARGSAAPVGVAGEMYVGGAGVARGYLGRAALTAERFVPDPFSTEGGARMYRTGDLGRWKADGTLEFMGRTDFQVKIRGFRIELGEIEAALGSHDAVRDALVMAREDAPGDRRLVAYYLADEAVAVDTLKAHLADRLPGYMVPAAYVWMQAYPLTPSGKTDRRALPAPGGDAFAARGYEAPAGATEEAVAAIWAGLLGVERVGRHDDFFQLGGNSLLATRLVFQIRREMDVELSVRDIFEKSELSLLAQHLLDAQLAEFDPDEIQELLALARAAEMG